MACYKIKGNLIWDIVLSHSWSSNIPVKVLGWILQVNLKIRERCLPLSHVSSPALTSNRCQSSGKPFNCQENAEPLSYLTWTMTIKKTQIEICKSVDETVREEQRGSGLGVWKRKGLFILPCMIWTGVTDMGPRYTRVCSHDLPPRSTHTQAIYRPAWSVQTRRPFSCLLIAISTFSFLPNKTRHLHSAAPSGLPFTSAQQLKEVKCSCGLQHTRKHIKKAWFCFQIATKNKVWAVSTIVFFKKVEKITLTEFQTTLEKYKEKGTPLPFVSAVRILLAIPSLPNPQSLKLLVVISLIAQQLSLWGPLSYNWAEPQTAQITVKRSVGEAHQLHYMHTLFGSGRQRGVQRDWDITAIKEF